MEKNEKIQKDLDTEQEKLDRHTEKFNICCEKMREEQEEVEKEMRMAKVLHETFEMQI